MLLTLVAPLAAVVGLTPIAVDSVLFNIWSAVKAKSEGMWSDLVCKPIKIPLSSLAFEIEINADSKEASDKSVAP